MLYQFPLRQLPTLSIPTLSILASSTLTKLELTKWELTKWEVDQMGIDKVGIDKVGRYPYCFLRNLRTEEATLKMIGGNAVGLFISKVRPSLKDMIPRDQIPQVNCEDTSHMTHFEATDHQRS